MSSCKSVRTILPANEGHELETARNSSAQRNSLIRIDKDDSVELEREKDIEKEDLVSVRHVRKQGSAAGHGPV